MYNPHNNSSNRQYGMCCVVNSELVTLPLIGVKVTGTINSISAIIKLHQTYFNDNLADIDKAVYTFPIPDRAVVNSFVMIKSNGSRILGRIESKSDAKVIFEKAVDESRVASLLDEEHADVFKVSVGNISAGEKIHIELSYATELTTDEENDQVRLHIPVSIGSRYGRHPVAKEFSCDTIQLGAVVNAFELEIHIESSNPITKIGSPSHNIETELGSTTSSPSSHFAKVLLYSRNTLDKDFILSIKSASLDSPRCIAEIHPRTKSLALALSMVPRFDVMEEIPRQEYIFVVDRSGSMEGSRIQMAKEALVVLLRSLPHKDTYIQVVSFGSHNSSLWSESKPYNQNTLMEASDHVESMDANYGGTEIYSALSSTFTIRRTDRHTSVFLLTDGDAWDVEKVLELVRATTLSAATSNQLRVFSLGIGESTSTAMIDGIARVGNGISTYVVDGEKFTGKVARLLKASNTPLITNIKIDWGVQSIGEKLSTKGADTKEDEAFEIISDKEVEDSKPLVPSKLSFFSQEAKPIELSQSIPPPPEAIKLEAPPSIQQSPYNLNSIVPGSRINLYAIIANPSWKEGDRDSESVTITGQLGSGQLIELVVPIKLNQLVDSPEIPPPIHTLAAKKIIQEFQDGRRNLNKDNRDIYERTLEAEVTRLGKTYSIASKYTSFVAVDESEIGKPRKATTKFKSASIRSKILSSGPMLMSAGAPVAKSRSSGAFGQTYSISSYSSPVAMSAPAPAIASSPTSASNSPALVDLARHQNFDGSFEIKLASLAGIKIDLNSIVESLSPEVQILPDLQSLLSTYIGILYLDNKIEESREAREGMHQKALQYWISKTGKYREEMESQVYRAWIMGMKT